MPDVVTKLCSSCKVPKPATSEYFHADKREPDGFHKYCKPCRATLRSKSVASAKRGLARQLAKENLAQAVLDNPKASYDQKERADRTVRLAEKHRKPFLDEIDNRRRELEARKLTPTPEDEAAEQARLDEADRIQNELDAQADRVWEAKQAQQERDEAAAKRALVQIRAKYARHFAAPMAMETRSQLSEHFKTMRANARTFARQANGFDSTGASQSFVSTAIADAFDELVKRLDIFTFRKNQPITDEEFDYYISACEPENFVWRTKQEQALLVFATKRALSARGYSESGLPDAPDPIWDVQDSPFSSLDALDSYEFGKMASAISMSENAAGILARVENIKESNPKEYARLIALVPKAVEPELVVYKIPMWTHENPYAKPRMFWAHGEEVGGNELVRDPYHGWVRVPGPASNEPDWFGEESKTEWIFDDQVEGGAWVKVAVGSVTTQWEQGEDGRWKATKSTGQLWEKPEKIIFKDGQRKPEGKNHFRHGYWFDDAQIAEFNSGTFDEPPIILPPDRRVKADFIAKANEVPLPEGPIESVWQRYERQQREEREQFRN